MPQMCCNKEHNDKSLYTYMHCPCSHYKEQQKGKSKCRQSCKNSKIYLICLKNLIQFQHCPAIQLSLAVNICTKIYNIRMVNQHLRTYSWRSSFSFWTWNAKNWRWEKWTLIWTECTRKNNLNKHCTCYFSFPHISNWIHWFLLVSVLKYIHIAQCTNKQDQCGPFSFITQMVDTM